MQRARSSSVVGSQLETWVIRCAKITRIRVCGMIKHVCPLFQGTQLREYLEVFKSFPQCKATSLPMLSPISLVSNPWSTP
jgi:hypothetical protein